ncbi:hypothetical protein OAM01_01760 [bacterium]|nr:hypothetical protein [bacterium]
MKSKTNSLGSFSFFFAALFSFLIPLIATAQVQQDSFDDGNDEGWARFSALDVVGASSIFSFPESPGDGHAYRLQSPAPAVDAAGPARSFTSLPQVYSDFYAAVDVLDWNNEVNQAFGMIFRADNIGLGQTTGYVMNYDPQQSSGARGQIQFNIVTNEADQGTIGAADISLEPGHDYRFVMTAEGETFRAWVYDHLDLTAPIVSYFGVNDLYANGSIGVFNFYRGGDATDPELGIADSTFDNFYSAPESPESLGDSVWYGFTNEPYIATLSPVNRATYQNAADGLRFSAILPEGMEGAPAFRLSLNGRDVTADVSVEVNEQVLNGSYEGLEANRVFDAVVELPDNTHVSRTEWTFDTFNQDFLVSDEAFVIEVEDYNFDGGQYINNPDPSGITEVGQAVNAATGYLDQSGLPDVDFFDYETTPGPEEFAALRNFDPVRTQAGSSETGSGEEFSGPDPAVNDVIRDIYANLDLPEYQVTDNEGGEWLNYTRDFPAGEYNIYLRAAGRATQEIHLDEVTSDPSSPDQNTQRVGTFTFPNMGMKFNYRFVPLKDAEGAMVRLTLGGIKTLRLTIGQGREDRINDTTALNYLLLAPAIEEQIPFATISVLAASTVDGEFEAAQGAVVEEGRIIVPVTEAMQFFKINLPNAMAASFALQGVSVQDGALVIQFTN